MLVDSMFAAMSLWLVISGSTPLKSVDYMHWEEYYYTDAQTDEVYYTESRVYEEPHSYLNSRYVDITLGANFETWGPVSFEPSFIYTIYETGEHFGSISFNLTLTRISSRYAPVFDGSDDKEFIYAKKGRFR